MYAKSPQHPSGKTQASRRRGEGRGVRGEGESSLSLRERVRVRGSSTDAVCLSVSRHAYHANGINSPTPTGRTAVANPTIVATKIIGQRRSIPRSARNVTARNIDSLYGIRKKKVVGNRANAQIA
jgi:hypothetical protein